MVIKGQVLPAGPLISSKINYATRENRPLVALVALIPYSHFKSAKDGTGVF